jgi:hypothetical protein
MFRKLQIWNRLRYKFSSECLLVHPVIGRAVISQTDIKEAEEAIGLVKAIDYTIIPIQDDLNIIDPDSTPPVLFSHYQG